MNIGKEKVCKSFLEKVLSSNSDTSFYYDFKSYHIEEKLNLGGYGYVDMFFYKKDYTDDDGEIEDVLDIRIITVSSNLAVFDDILKCCKIKRGVFKYLREIVGIGDEMKIYYSNYLLCPGFKEDGFEIMSQDISDLSIYRYSFDTDGFNIYNIKDRFRQLVTSNKVLKRIKSRLLK